MGVAEGEAPLQPATTQPGLWELFHGMGLINSGVPIVGKYIDFFT